MSETNNSIINNTATENQITEFLNDNDNNINDIFNNININQDDNKNNDNDNNNNNKEEKNMDINKDNNIINENKNNDNDNDSKINININKDDNNNIDIKKDDNNIVMNNNIDINKVDNINNDNKNNDNDNNININKDDNINGDINNNNINKDYNIDDDNNNIDINKDDKINDKKNCTRKKNIIFGFIIVLLFMGLIIGISFLIKYTFFKEKEEKEIYFKCEDYKYCLYKDNVNLYQKKLINETLVIDPNYTIYKLYNYTSIKKTETKIFSINKDNNRNLNELKTINENFESNVLFYIYDINFLPNQLKKIKAYLFLSELSVNLNNEQKNYKNILEGVYIQNLTLQKLLYQRQKNDIIEENIINKVSDNNDSNSFVSSDDSSDDDEENLKILNPIFQVIFYENGTIDDIKYYSKVNTFLKSFMIDFIKKIIVKISLNLYTQNKKEIYYDSENIKRKINKNFNETPFILQNEINSYNLGEFINQQENYFDSNTTIYYRESNDINKIESNSSFIIKSNNSNQFEDIKIKDNLLSHFSNNKSFQIENNLNKIISNISNIIELNNCEFNAKFQNKYKNLINEEIIEKYYSSYKEENAKENITKKILKGFNINKENIVDGNLFINYPELLKIKNNNDSLRKLNIDNFSNNIKFSVPIFKTNFMGVKLASFVLIDFFPSNGTLYEKYIYQQDNITIIIKENIEYTNYDKLLILVKKIVHKFSNKINDLNSLFSGKKWNEEYKVNITENIKKVINVLNNTYNMTETFNKPLKNVYDKVQEIRRTYYDRVKSNITVANEYLTTIINNLTEKLDQNLLNLLATINEEYNNFLDNVYQNYSIYDEKTIDILIDLDKIVNEIEGNMDIESYFLITEMVDKIGIEYQKFKEKIFSAINIAIKDYKNKNNLFIENLFKNHLEKLYNISYKLNVNQTMIDIINKDDREFMIESLKNYTLLIDDIKDLIFKKFDELYNDLGNYTNKNNEITKKINSINEKYDIFLDYKKTLISDIKKGMLKIDNYEFYLTDLKIVDEIRKNINFTKNEKMNEYFYEDILKIKNTFLTEKILNNFENNLNFIVSEMINNINNNNDISNNLNVYNKSVKDFIDKYLGDNLINKYYNIYANKSFINNQLKKYYEDIRIEVDEFNNTFYNKYFSNNYKNFGEKPVELIYKFSQILRELNNSANYTFNFINEIIFEALNKLLKDTYNKIILYVDLNYKNLTIHLNNSNNNINNLFDNILSNIKTLSNTIQIEYIKSSLNLLSNSDPFSLNLNIKKEEELFYSNILRIKGYIESDFTKYFCNDSASYNTCNIEMLALNVSTLTLQKFRGDYYIFEKIEHYFNNLIKDKDFNNYLKPNIYSSLLINNTNFNKFMIQNKISSFYNNINEDNKQFIEPYIKELNDLYKKELDKIINQKTIENSLNNFTDIVFRNPDSITNLLQNYINNLSNLFENYRNSFFYRNLYLEEENYLKKFQDFKLKFEEKLNESKSFINDYLLNSEFIPNTTSKYKLIYDNIQNEMIKENEKVNKKFNNFTLLSLSYNLIDIGLEQFENLKKNYYEIIENQTNSTYENKFKEFKNNISNYLTNVINEINDTFTNEYKNTYQYLKNKSNNIYKDTMYQISKINDNLINNVLNITSDFNNKIKYSYDNDILMNFKNNLYKLDFVCDFEQFYNNLYNFSNNLNNLCINKADNDKLEFFSLINENIINNFEFIFSNFSSNTSKIYLTELVNKLYKYKFKNFFDYIKLLLSDMNELIIKYFEIPEFNQIYDNSKQTILNLYDILSSNIKTFSTQNIQNISNIYINNIISESSLNILNNYEENIIKLLNEKNYLENLGIFSNLIPKEFSSIVKNKIINFMKTKINNNELNNLNILFTNVINNDIINIQQYLNLLKSNLNILINEKESEENPKTFTIINMKIDYYINNFFPIFQSKFTYTNYDKKNTYLKNIFNSILPYFNNIFSSDDDVDSEKIYNIKIVLNSFENYNDQLKALLKAEENTEISKISFDNINELKTIIKNNILEDFSNLEQIILNDSITFNLDLNDTENDNTSSSLRNLNEIDIPNINTALNLYEKSYKYLSNKLKNLDEILILQNEYQSFIDLINFSIENLTNPFQSYLLLLSNDLTKEQFKNFSSVLYNQSNDMINQAKDYLKNESEIIESILNIISNDYQELFYNIKTDIKSKIDTSILYIYDIIFNNVKKIDYFDNSKENDIAKYSYTTYNTDNFVNFTSQISTIEFDNKMKLEYGNDYKFYILLSVHNKINMSLIYETSSIKTSLNGIVSDTEVKINSIHDFLKEKMNLTIDYNKYESNYSTIISKRKQNCIKKSFCDFTCQKCDLEWEDEVFNYNIKKDLEIFNKNSQ